MANSLGIRGYDFVEFYVGSAKMVSYWFAKALGLTITAYSGPETGCRDRSSYLLEKDKLKFLVSSPLQPSVSDMQLFLQTHGDGVKRFALEVDDVGSAFNDSVKNGAIPQQVPMRLSEDDKGYVETAAIRLYDDSEIVFINRDNYEGHFMPSFGSPIQTSEVVSDDTGLSFVDHIVGNVRENEMNLWASYFNKTMDFETFVDFGPGDISTKYSALLSKVVRSKDNVIKNPINEPFEGVRMSQIEEFIKEYHGTGIQHIAIQTNDILSSIKVLRANGVEFLKVPDTYYDAMRAAAPDIKEDIDDLQRLGILMDFEGDGYLLQLFTKPIFDRPTFFFEIIQRRGKSEGFGQGNFQALFEAIELDQEKRGNLV